MSTAIVSPIDAKSVMQPVHVLKSAAAKTDRSNWRRATVVKLGIREVPKSENNTMPPEDYKQDQEKTTFLSTPVVSSWHGDTYYA